MFEIFIHRARSNTRRRIYDTRFTSLLTSIDILFEQKNNNYSHIKFKIIFMNAKALLIPIAALALSATGVSAFNGDVLEKAGLTNDQISAFETAHELRKEGDKDGARSILEKAGIDIETMESVRKAMHEHKDAMRTAIDLAVENNDYESFLKAIEGSPMADIVNTEEDFKMFAEAHQLRADGDMEAAKEIMDELGFQPRGFGPMGGHRMGMHEMGDGENGKGGRGGFGGFVNNQ